MKRKKTYFVYIMASAARVIYIGFTSTLRARVSQHRNNRFKGFSARYNCCRLVYFERYSEVGQALARETQLKNWSREKKIALIESVNLNWKDLGEDWYEDPPRINYF